MTIAAFILIAAGILLFIFTPLFDPRDANTINQISRREARRRELIEQRDMVYEAIRELDFDHRMGKVERRRLPANPRPLYRTGSRTHQIPRQSLQPGRPSRRPNRRASPTR